MPAGVRANNWAFNRWAQPAQRVVRGRLAEMQAFGGAGDAPLMRVRLPIPPSREALQPPVRVASARSIDPGSQVDRPEPIDRPGKSGPLWSS